MVLDGTLVLVVAVLVVIALQFLANLLVVEQVLSLLLLLHLAQTTQLQWVRAVAIQPMEAILYWEPLPLLVGVLEACLVAHVDTTETLVALVAVVELVNIAAT